MTVEVRCSACLKGLRITRVRPSEEFSEARALRRDMVERCPRNRGSNALPCPMSDVNHEPEAERAA